jgi:hypothetical protein
MVGSKVEAFSKEGAYDEVIAKLNPRFWECPSNVGFYTV